MPADSLSALNWATDQTRFVGLQPTLFPIVTLVRSIYARNLDSDGVALAARVLRAILRASEDIRPALMAPIAHQMVFLRVRAAVCWSLLAMSAAQNGGEDGLVLTETATAALAAIETADPLIGPVASRAADLVLLLAGVVWRRDTINA